MDEFTLYIAANGAVKAQGYASELFSNYENVTDIIFADAFDTSGITNMYGLFSGCSSLESLDLSSFDTSNVEDMSYMFHGCDSLPDSDKI